jgi:hypothetical protein
LRIFRKRKDPDAGTCDTASNTVTWNILLQHETKSMMTPWTLYPTPQSNNFIKYVVGGP